MSVRATHEVSGMSCEHCVRAVSQAVSEVPGVVGVDVALESGSITVESAQPVAEEDLREAVTKAGYTLVS